MNGWLQELRDKPRLRLALLLVAGLVWVYALLELEAASAGARAERDRLLTEVERMEAIRADTGWEAQRDAVFTQLTALRSQMWRAESEGRMQALLQDWLRAELAAQKLQLREVSVAVLPTDKTDAASDVRRLRARLVFDFDADGLHALLGQLAAAPQRCWVPRLVVRNAGRPSVEMDVETLFILGSEGVS